MKPRFLRNADAGADNGAGTSDSTASGTQTVDKTTEPGAQDKTATGQASGADKQTTESGTQQEQKTDEAAKSAREIELEKQLSEVRKEAAEKRKKAQEEMRKNGEHESLLKEKETELETVTRELSQTKNQLTTMETKAKLWDAHEKSERTELLKQIPAEKQSDFKNFTNEQIRIVLREAKPGFGQQSQGTSNGAKATSPQKVGILGALSEFYGNR